MALTHPAAVQTAPARSAREVPVAPTPLAYRLTKRALDIGLSLAGLAVTAPLMVAIAAAIRADSPGPAVFRQQRLGLGGRPFTLFKFRTMKADADQDAHRAHVGQLLRASRHRAPVTTPGPSEGGHVWTPIRSDPRLTRIGPFLRRTHLDELPQLVNVLRGDMSLVGPRPPIWYERELYDDWHLRRLAVKPGLTGLWQVEGWGRLSFDEGVRLDLDYIDRRSLALDLRIILRTILQIVRRRQF